MAAMDSLQNSENPNGSEKFSDHTMVYIDLKTTGFGINTEVVQIGAHFAENSFSRYVSPTARYLCPSGTVGKKTDRQTYISQKDGILYLGGERVETVSKMDAWKDFLKFLQSANNRVVLVTHHKFNGSYTLLRDFLQLSLMVQLRKVCAGVVDTLPVCKHLFPGRLELGKHYSVRELVKDVLGEEISPYDATVRARNLEKLMKHADVQPEMLQQHFSTLSDMEYGYHLQRVKSGRRLRSNRKKTSAHTPDVNKEAKKMTTKDSLQNSENPNHFPDHTMVYWGLLATGAPTRREVCQIGAHFAEKSFSRYMCPTSTFRHKATKRTGLSMKDGILYLGEERVDTVSKMDAWKDFLKFLQSANNSVVLVTYNRSDFYSLLFQDLSELSLMEDFRKVCVGLIDTLPLCQDIFPPRNAFGRNYILEGLVEDELGEVNSSGHYNATVNAINLEKLMKYAKVEPETFQQHFFSLAYLEYRHELKRKNLLRKAFKKEARAKMETGEDSSTSLPSRRRNRRANREKTSAVTPDVSKQAEETTTKDSLGNNEDSNGIYDISDHAMVYIDLKSASNGKRSEICEIGAHFSENSFLRYVRPNGTFGKQATKQTGLFKKDGIFYFRGERVETVSKMDAWEDFLEFLRSANNSVILVIHERQNNCSLLCRDMSELSLMEEFKRVCIGVIDTLPLCKKVYPGRWKIGMDYGLKELVQDRLGEEDSIRGYTTTVNAINLERLIQRASVKPEMFQQHFLSLSKIESQTDRWKRRLQRKAESKARRLNSSSKESGEDSSAALLSGRMEATIPEASRKENGAVTPNVSKQVTGKMTTKDRLRLIDSSNISRHLHDYTMVYFDLTGTSSGRDAEVCQIQAHFGEISFSRFVCPKGSFARTTLKRTRFSKQDGILYHGGERVETVSKKDAWKDFLKFLQSAYNSVVLVIHNRRRDYFVLFRDLSKLKLMEGFREVCIGVIDMLHLCRDLFPGRQETENKYKLRKLLRDELGEENSSDCHNTRVDAMNLEKLMKHVSVQPEIVRRHFFSLDDLEYQINRLKNLLRVRTEKDCGENSGGRVIVGESAITPQINKQTKLPKVRKKTAKRKRGAAGITYHENKRSSVECGERVIVGESAITPDVSKQGEKMAGKDSLQNNENPNGSHHFSEHTKVYFDLEGTGSGCDSEVCQIGAHFTGNSFSRYVCPVGKFTIVAETLTGLTKKDGILYLRGQRVETVSKMDAWKDFMKFLQSANNSVVLVMHDRHNDCFLLFRDMSELSLMEEFRKVCIGVIDTLPLCLHIFPGRKEIGKNYKLEDVVQDELGEETSADSHNAIADAINLEKLMKHANVQPEIFQQHFFLLSDLEYKYQITKEARLLWNKFYFMGSRGAKKMAAAGITYNDLERSYIEGGEDGITSFLSAKINIAKSNPKAIKEKTLAIIHVFRESGISNLEGSSQLWTEEETSYSWPA